MRFLVTLWFALTALVVAQQDSVSVAVCGEEVAFERVPTRVVVFEANMIEIMLELGLDEKIVGVWTGGVPAERVQPHYAERTAHFPVLSESGWPPPGLETVLGADPDFVWTGWGYGFSEDRGLTPDALAAAGIATYIVNESCARGGGEQATGFDTLFVDILAAGAIFGVPERAEALVAALEAEVETVRAALEGVTQPVRVFNFDSGQDSAFTSGAQSMPNTIITTAGGTNIFGDVARDWLTVSWEEVVGRDPEVILVSDSDWAPFEENVAFLMGLPVLADVSAIRNERFVRMTYKQATPGLENVDAVRTIAHALHPERFAQ